MLCYRDMTYCSNAGECANREICFRYFSPEEEERAIQWWGGVDVPVAFSPLKDTCGKFKEIADDQS